jgi:hypothetical protein
MMTTTIQSRRQIHVMQAIFAGAATIAMLAACDATQPDTAESVVTSGSVRLVDQATGRPAPATVPFGPQLPQISQNVVGHGGFAADDDDDQDERNQIAQQTEEEWDDYWAQDEDPNVNNPNNP